MRSLLMATFAGAALTLGGASTASADDHGFGHHRFRGGWNYGNGGHDLAPHWHKTNTPFGPAIWYGNGPHDLMPHNHSVRPFSGVRSYSYTPFGPTTSYNGFPGYGSYYGGLGYGGFGYGGFRPW